MVSIGCGIAVAVGACAWGLPAALRGRCRHRLAIRRLDDTVPSDAPGETLRVVTLNLAHGRGNRMIQRFTRRRRTQQHLGRVAEFLRDQRPHVVALQEADVKALWSGRFNHVDYLARMIQCATYTQMRHVDGMGLAYGTALLSSCDLRDGCGGTFRPSPPTFAKGWVTAVVPWAAVSGGALRVVSLHLDFSRASCRQSQLRELARALAAEDELPLLIMGDFNCDGQREPAMHELMARLGLHTVEPDSALPATYPATGRRLDWILASSHLRFVHHAVLAESVSDHLPVMAELAPSPPLPPSAQ